MKIIAEIGIKRLGKYFIFGLWQWVFDLLPFSPLRVWWLLLGGAKIGSNCVIDRVDFINLDRKGLTGLKIGRDCFLGRGALLDLAGEIHLEDQVTVSPRACILTHFSVGFSDHPLLVRYPKKVSGVRGQKGCFIGVNAIILPGTNIGPSSLVAAQAVVKGSVPSGKMVAGVPARIKK